MTGDRLIRAATAVTVLLVAAIAAIVSYQHLYHLAITHGETGWTPRSCPCRSTGPW
jgi:hypothetical protein